MGVRAAAVVDETRQSESVGRFRAVPAAEQPVETFDDATKSVGAGGVSVELVERAVQFVGIQACGELRRATQRSG